MQDWTPLEDAFKNEADIRKNVEKDKLCTFGIKPLDDALICMARNELVVIGADSGVGKSEMCLQIARTNIKKGKKVALYYLEGGYEEAIQRMKWANIAEEYYKNYSHKGIDMDYKKWILNLIEDKDKVLDIIESKVWDDYKEQYKNNLMFYSAKGGLDIEKFLSSLLEFHKLVRIKEEGPFNTEGKLDVDLVIIDHLQYFSLMKAESELFEITEILRAVKNITEHFKVPVVLISHLRKKTKDRGLPDQQDFYGSSNIPKIASTAITIASATEKDNLRLGLYPTYIRVVKSRIGIRSNYAFLINFNLAKRSYENRYEISRLDNWGNVLIDPITEDEKPKWYNRKDIND